MTTSRELLDLIAAYVAEHGGTADDDRLQDIAQRFDVALGDAILDRASMANEA
ncbi:hypothetical protein ACXR2U_02870 [Jatrophihabitans sp. YIM 134969]